MRRLIYYTGDIHGSTLEIVTFCARFQPSKDDTIVIHAVRTANGQMLCPLNIIKLTVLGKQDIGVHFLVPNDAAVPLFGLVAWNILRTNFVIAVDAKNGRLQFCKFSLECVISFITKIVSTYILHRLNPYYHHYRTNHHFFYEVPLS